MPELSVYFEPDHCDGIWSFFIKETKKECECYKVLKTEGVGILSILNWWEEHIGDCPEQVYLPQNYYLEVVELSKAAHKQVSTLPSRLRTVVDECKKRHGI